MEEKRIKRVLHVLSGLHTGGVQSFVMNYYRAIDKDKIQFDFAVMDEVEGDLEEEALSLGARIFRLRSITDDRSGCLQDLIAVLKQNPEISVVHAHLNFLNYYVLKVARKCNINVRVSHSHSNYPASSLIVRLARIFLRQGIRRNATKMLACSNVAGVWLYGKRGVKNKNFRLIYNAIDYKPYFKALKQRNEIRKELGLSNETVFVHVGSMSPVKNQNFLVDVMKYLVQQDKNKKLLLIGDGDLRELVEKKCYESSLRENISFFGNRRNVCDFLAAGDCFVLPSLFEGLSLVTIEAQFSGLPCVISEHVPKDVILNESTLRIPLDVKKWCKEMQKIEKGSIAVRENRAEKLVGGNYDIELQVGNLLDVYI